MKNVTKMMITAVLLCTAIVLCQAHTGRNATAEEGQLNLICSPLLEDLATQMAWSFREQNPGVPVSVEVVPDHLIAEKLTGSNFALVHKGCGNFNGNQPSYRMVVGRDAIVPIINAGNPHRDLITKSGISSEGFRTIYATNGGVTWGGVLGISDNTPVKVYAPDDPCSHTYLAEFIRSEPGDLEGIGISGSDAMLRAVAGDKHAVGFCKLADLMKSERQEGNTGIMLVPVDGDGNGKIEHFEDIYRCCSDLEHGIFLGRFPRALYSRIYLVANKQPVDEAAIGFAQWMVAGGQNNLASLGILGIEYSEKARGISQLLSGENQQAEMRVPVLGPATKMILLIFAGLVLLTGVVIMISYRSGRRKDANEETSTQSDSVFAREGLAHPAGLFYDRSHTWTYMEKDGRVRVGLDDFIQHVTGPLTRVVMKETGEMVRRGEPFLKLVQHGKQLEIKSPVTGKVEVQNTGLLKEASILNREPYSGGWIYLIQPVNWLEELKSYLLGERYMEWLKYEFARLRDFLSTGKRVDQEPVPVMQDGGEIRDAVLEIFGPQDWEEFQLKFLDRAH